MPSGFIASANSLTDFGTEHLIFAGAWSAFSLGGIYGSQIYKGQFNPRLSLFGIPFLFAVPVLCTQALLRAYGRIDVRKDGDLGTVFTGIRAFGRSQHFRFSDLVSVTEEFSFCGSRRRPGRVIVLSFRVPSRPPLKFGSLLQDDQRYFLIELISAQILVPPTLIEAIP